MTKSVAIVGPILSDTGGVSNFYRVILPHLEQHADYYEFGGRGPGQRIALIADLRRIFHP